jgi:hypothetical protein
MAMQGIVGRDTGQSKAETVLFLWDIAELGEVGVKPTGAGLDASWFPSSFPALAVYGMCSSGLAHSFYVLFWF